MEKSVESDLSTLPGADNNGDLHDQEGHLRNAAGQRIDAQGAAVPERDDAAQPKTLADYNRQDQFYTNRSAIRPPTIQRDYELKTQYYTLVIPYHGLSHEHPMDHLERFEDLVSAIKVKGVPKGYLLCKLFKVQALPWDYRSQDASIFKQVSGSAGKS